MKPPDHEHAPYWFKCYTAVSFQSTVKAVVKTKPRGDSFLGHNFPVSKVCSKTKHTKWSNSREREKERKRNGDWDL